jgi:hypothetical protein
MVTAIARRTPVGGSLIDPGATGTAVIEDAYWRAGPWRSAQAVIAAAGSSGRFSAEWWLARPWRETSRPARCSSHSHGPSVGHGARARLERGEELGDFGAGGRPGVVAFDAGHDVSGLAVQWHHARPRQYRAAAVRGREGAAVDFQVSEAQRGGERDREPLDEQRLLQDHLLTHPGGCAGG